MRLWVGKEREGKKNGVQTLFVCGAVITTHDAAKVIVGGLMHATKRLYFGAGKVDLEQVPCELLQLMRNSGTEVVVEVSAANASQVPCAELFDEIIVRVDANINTKASNVTLKLDNGREVRMYDQGYTENIIDVQNGMYVGTDIEIEV